MGKSVKSKSRSDMRVAIYYRSKTDCASKGSRVSCERSIALTQVNEPVDCRTLTGRQRMIETRAAYKELSGSEE